MGEVAFLTNQKANTSYRARENSDLYYITKNEFDIVLEHFPEVRDRLMEEAKESMERDTENQLLFEKRPHKQTTQNSLTYQPLAKIPLSVRFEQIKSHIFRSDDKFIRYFSKFFMTALRAISTMLILYQPCFNSYGLEFYVTNYLLEAMFLLDVFVKLRLGFVDDFGKNGLLENKEPPVVGCMFFNLELSRADQTCHNVCRRWP